MAKCLFQPIPSSYLMGLAGILYFSIFLFTPIESTSRAGYMWPQNTGVESIATVSWTVFSSSIFVLVALVLSMYLIFEHLSAYNKPEVHPVFRLTVLAIPSSILFSLSIHNMFISNSSYFILFRNRNF